MDSLSSSWLCIYQFDQPYGQTFFNCELRVWIVLTLAVHIVCSALRTNPLSVLWHGSWPCDQSWISSLCIDTILDPYSGFSLPIANGWLSFFIVRPKILFDGGIRLKMPLSVLFALKSLKSWSFFKEIGNFEWV